MLVLGVILILLAAGLLVGFLSSGTQQVTFDGGFLNITMSTLTIYLLGAATLLLLVLGLSLVRRGTRAANRRRKEHKELGRVKAKLDKHEATRGDEATTHAETTGPTGTTGSTGTTGTTGLSDEGPGTTRT